MSTKVTRLEPKRGGKASGPGANAGDTEPGLEGIRALGFDHGVYYYLSPLTGQLVQLTAGDHGAANLCTLQRLTWWETEFPSNSKQQPFALPKARMALMEACHRTGPFDPTLVRGRGFWIEDDGPVLHEGSWIRNVKGAGWEPSRAPYPHIYEAAAPWRDMIGQPLDEDDGLLLLDVIEQFPWAEPVFARLFAGWLVIAPVCGALDWRPHIWITGPAGVGKSWLLEHVVLPVLGPIALAVQAATTEAGLRQKLGADARPIVFDEAEAHKATGQARIERVLEFARYMSSAGEAEVVKGGVGHEAVSFTGAAAICMASINVALARQADETRFSVLELRGRQPGDGDPTEAFAALRAATASLNGTFARSLLATTFLSLGTLRENVRRFSSAIAHTYGNARVGDQLGTLLAGAWLLRSQNLVDPNDALAQVADLPQSLLEAAKGEPDHVRCLVAIAAAPLRVDTESGKRQVTRTLGGLITRVLGFEYDDALNVRECELALGRHGIRVLPAGFWGDGGPAGQHVAIANEHHELRRILANTDFAAGHRHLLLRLPQAISSPHPVRFGPGQPKQRAVLIPAYNLKVSDEVGQTGQTP